MTMSVKLGFCPVCKGSVKRQGIRKDGIRYTVVPYHSLGGMACAGTYMPWYKAIGPKSRIKVNIEDVSNGEL